MSNATNRIDWQDTQNFADAIHMVARSSGLPLVSLTEIKAAAFPRTDAAVFAANIKAALHLGMVRTVGSYLVVG